MNTVQKIWLKFLRLKKIGGITAKMIIKNMTHANLLSTDGDSLKKIKMEKLSKIQVIILVIII